MEKTEKEQHPRQHPEIISKAVLRLVKEYDGNYISFETFRHGLAMYGIGLYLHPDTQAFKIHVDQWAWEGVELPEEFKAYFRTNRKRIESQLEATRDSTWNVTPQTVMKHLAKWKEYDEGVRRLIYGKALALGVLSYIALKPWEESPPLHETKEQRARREALEFLETITENKNNIAGVDWEWDEGPGLNWCRCTYPDGRISTHFFISKWWEGMREQRCDCPARVFNPKKPCKHEQARLYEWQRRVRQKDAFGDLAGSNYPAEDELPEVSNG